MANELLFEYTVASGDFRQIVMAETWHIVDGRLVFRAKGIDVAAFDYWNHFYMTQRALMEAISMLEKAKKDRLAVHGPAPMPLFPSPFEGLCDIRSGFAETAEPEQAPRGRICLNCSNWRPIAPDNPWGVCGKAWRNLPPPPGAKMNVVGVGAELRTLFDFSCSFYLEATDA